MRTPLPGSSPLVGGYPEQFKTNADPLEITIPRAEVIAAMLTMDEEVVLDQVCLAVALVADALESARSDG